MSDSVAENFLIRVGISRIFGRKPLIPKAGRSGYRSVTVNPETRMGDIKNVVLEHLGYPYPQLFAIRRKDKDLFDSDSIAGLNIKPDDSKLEIVCKDLESLHSELRRAGKL